MPFLLVIWHALCASLWLCPHVSCVCMSIISGIEACPAASVRPFGSVLYESGKLTVKGHVMFCMVALRLPEIPLHLLAFSLVFLHLYSILKNLTSICRFSFLSTWVSP